MPNRGLVDPELSALVGGSRTWGLLAGTALTGLLSAASLVVQAVALGRIVARVLSAGRGVSLSMTGRAAVGGFLVVVAVGFLARGLLGGLGEVLATRAATSISGRLRRGLVDRIVDGGPAWTSGERAGELAIVGTRGIEALEVWFGRYLPQVIVAVVAPMAILVWVGWEDPWSMLVALGIVALVPPAMILAGRGADREARRQWRQLSKLSARFTELLAFLPTLRTFGGEAAGLREIEESSEALRRTTMRTLRAAFVSGLAIEFLSGIGVGLVAMVLGLRLLDGQVGVATAIGVLLVTPEIFLPLRRAGAEFHASAEGRAASTRILDLLRPTAGSRAGEGAEARATEPAAPAAAAPAAAAPAAAAPAAAAPAAVEVRHLSAGYDGRGGAVLEGISMAAAPGEHVLVVGRSGSGKSTLLAVLMGFVAPIAGEVRLGGRSIVEVPRAEWLEGIAWVPQRPHLFTGSIGENLRLGRRSASDDELWEVLEAVGLAAWVGALGGGLTTPIGEAGIEVSAGERGRLAIARAMLRPAGVVLMDEPGAHLDEATEEELGETLAGWLEGRTVVMAAHRRELLGRVDREIHLGADAPEDDATGDPR